MASATYFVTPIRFRRPGILPSTPLEDQVPAKYFSNPDGLTGQGVNVFVLPDGSFTEVQPALYSEFTSIYLGGHYNGPLTQAEIDALTAAGYGTNLVVTDLGDTVTTAGYGGGGFGTGGYGT